MNTCCRLITSLMAAALAVPAFGASSGKSNLDEYGLEREPLCSYALPESLQALQKELPSGEYVQTAGWKAEIYVNRDRGTWTLVGTRLGPNEDPDEMCPLARGVGDYRTQKWYQAYFAQRK